MPHLFPRLLVSSSHNAQILAFWFEAVPPLKSVICPPSCLYSWEAARRKCPGMLRACLSRADLLWHSPKAHSMFPAAILKVFILTNPKIESFILYQVSQTHPFLRQAESWNWVREGYIIWLRIHIMKFYCLFLFHGHHVFREVWFLLGNGCIFQIARHDFLVSVWSLGYK